MEENLVGSVCRFMAIDNQGMVPINHYLTIGRDETGQIQLH